VAVFLRAPSYPQSDVSPSYIFFASVVRVTQHKKLTSGISSLWGCLLSGVQVIHRSYKQSQFS